MTGWMRKRRRGACDAGAARCRLRSRCPRRIATAQVPTTPQGGFVLKVNAELVLTNVVARDAKTGELVHGLKQSDFTIYENGKEQQIVDLRFSERRHGHAAERGHGERAGRRRNRHGSKAVVVAKPEDLRNHRLIVMFFDLTSMQPEDLDRSVEAAQAFPAQPRCSRPTWWRWFRSATRSTSTRTLPPTRTR